MIHRSKWLMGLCVLMALFSCVCIEDDSLQAYEGTYILDANARDTLIISNIEVNKYGTFYYGDYERRVGVDDSVVIVADRFAWDVTMSHLEFDHWVLVTQEEKKEADYFFFKHQDHKRNYVTMRWYRNIFGDRFIGCDLDHLRCYEQQ